MGKFLSDEDNDKTGGKVGVKLSDDGKNVVIFPQSKQGKDALETASDWIRTTFKDDFKFDDGMATISFPLSDWKAGKGKKFIIKAIKSDISWHAEIEDMHIFKGISSQLPGSTPPPGDMTPAFEPASSPASAPPPPPPAPAPVSQEPKTQTSGYSHIADMRKWIMISEGLLK